MKLPQDTNAVNSYIEHYFGVPLEALLEPIGENQVGESVRHNGVYFNIKEARQADDPTLPMGVWSHELKTADWYKVKQIALDALCNKSKDLQLGIWLFEANLHLIGFAGIAPAATLIEQLCRNYWENMHPQVVDDDLEYRTNPVVWLNDKMLPQIKLLPLTNAPIDGQELNWSDWENGLRYEKLEKQNKLKKGWDVPTPKSFKQRLAVTRVEHIQSLISQLDDGLIALDRLQSWFDQTCGNDSPSLMDLMNLLKDINQMMLQELERRGVKFSEQSDNQDSADHSNDEQQPSGAGGGDGFLPNGMIRNRIEAFECLRKAADYLMRDDPHSPVPYLIYTACEWGEKSAPDLYQQLFLNQGGQLNIFQIMGLDVQQKN